MNHFNTTVTCGWCHGSVLLIGGKPTTCPACGHDAGAPRLDCTCGQCLRFDTSPADDLFWADLMRAAERAGKYRPLTPAEAEAACCDAPEASLTDAEIERIVDYAMRGGPQQS